jgi:hypothetical protein
MKSPPASHIVGFKKAVALLTFIIHSLCFVIKMYKKRAPDKTEAL